MENFSPKALRSIAKMMLDLADAIDEGQVHRVEPGTEYVQHEFVSAADFSHVFADEEIREKPIKAIRCKHDLKFYVFHLVGVQCLVSKEFFIDLKRTRALVESSYYLTGKVPAYSQLALKES